MIGLLGSTLDRGQGPQHWEQWRPTVALYQHDELLVSRFELLYPPACTKLAAVISGDIATVSPEIEVRLTPITVADPWDFAQVYGALHDFARGHGFQPEQEDYLVHITTGTHVAQICLFLLTESHHFPAKLLQTAPPRCRHRGSPDRFKVIDLDLSKYDRLAARCQQEQDNGTSLLKSGIAIGMTSWRASTFGPFACQDCVSVLKMSNPMCSTSLSNTPSVRVPTSPSIAKLGSIFCVLPRLRTAWQLQRGNETEPA